MSYLRINCVEATTFTVANLYYVQPILFKIADTFDVGFERASSVATLLQAGYACGLLLLCPLGDIFRRRHYILVLVAFTATLVSTTRDHYFVPLHTALLTPDASGSHYV